MNNIDNRIDDKELKTAVRGKGIGAEATRADIIEQLIAAKYAERNEKSIVATEFGKTFISSIPDTVKSVERTAEWEQIFTNIKEKGISAEPFMEDVKEFVEGVIKYENNSARHRPPVHTPEGSGPQRTVVGICPKCKKNIYEVENYYCEMRKTHASESDGCGFTIWKEPKFFNDVITPEKAEKLIRGEAVPLRATNKDDLETANSQPKAYTEDGKGTYPLKIGDKVYTDRSEAVEAFKDAVLKNIGIIVEGKNVPVGEYRGLKLSILFDSSFKTTKACLEGEKHHYCDLTPETTTGNLIRLDNCINNIEKDIQQSQEKVDTMKAELEQMKIDVEIPFSKADELLKAESRLEEVHEALTKFELSDDSMHREIYERIADNFADVMFGKTATMKFEAGEGWDTLSVELNDNIFSIAHSYEQNGDLMYDPMICFIVDYEKEKVIPISYENSGMGIFESYDSEAEPAPQTVQNVNSVLDFMDTWLDNIEQQGYKPVVLDEGRNKVTNNIAL